jgi:hypothetical protein
MHSIYIETVWEKLKTRREVRKMVMSLSMPDFAADSKERTAVVPMAIMRPPLALVWLTFSGVCVSQSLLFCVMVGRLLVGFV